MPDSFWPCNECGEDVWTRCTCPDPDEPNGDEDE